MLRMSFCYVHVGFRNARPDLFPTLDAQIWGFGLRYSLLGGLAFSRMLLGASNLES